MLLTVREALSDHYQAELGERFVTAGLCLYRDGRDSAPGAEIGSAAPQRRTRWSPSSRSAAPARSCCDHARGAPSRRLALGHGDLVVMGGSCQRTWDHAIPRPRGRRAAHLDPVPRARRSLVGRALCACGDAAKYPTDVRQVRTGRRSRSATASREPRRPSSRHRRAAARRRRWSVRSRRARPRRPRPSTAATTRRTARSRRAAALRRPRGARRRCRHPCWTRVPGHREHHLRCGVLTRGVRRAQRHRLPRPEDQPGDVADRHRGRAPRAHTR